MLPPEAFVRESDDYKRQLLRRHVRNFSACSVVQNYSSVEGSGQMFSKKPLSIPSASEALPGRADPMPVPDEHFVNHHPLQPPFPAGLETAMFGMGCFWGAERKFWQLKGVYSTAVGYAAGSTPNPTYREVCTGMTGHNEVVLVVFDPKVLPYDQLLKTFWENHDPTQRMRQGND